MVDYEKSEAYKKAMAGKSEAYKNADAKWWREARERIAVQKRQSQKESRWHRAQRLRKSGKTYKEISKAMDISQVTVSSLLKYKPKGKVTKTGLRIRKKK